MRDAPGRQASRTHQWQAWLRPRQSGFVPAPLGSAPWLTQLAQSFGSDNHAGVHPAVLAAITAANVGDAVAYGDDELTRSVLDRAVCASPARSRLTLSSTAPLPMSSALACCCGLMRR